MFQSARVSTLCRAAGVVATVRRRTLIFVIGLGLAFPVWPEALFVGGTGSSEPLMTLLFDEFNKSSPEVGCMLVRPPLGSAGAVNALVVGKIDLAIVARPLSIEEKAVLGQYFNLADTPFVLVTNGGQRRRGFTLDELGSAYVGGLKAWDNGEPIRLVLRTRDDSDSAQLRSMSPAMARAVNLAEQRPGMVYGRDDMDTLALLGRVPGSLGPGTLGLLRTSGARLTALPINGVTPSLDNLKNGSYPWHKTLSVVLPLQPSPAAEKFADFLRSKKAGELMRRNDYLPARP